MTYRKTELKVWILNHFLKKIVSCNCKCMTNVVLMLGRFFKKV